MNGETTSTARGIAIQFVSAFILVLSGCAMPNITPRQNFDLILRDLVGSNIGKHEVTQGLADKQGLLKSRSLTNGNIENEYALLARTRENPEMQCIYTLEYNPESRIVVAARIRSGADACFIPL